MLGKNVVLFCERRLDCFRSCRDCWAGIAARELDKRRVQDVVHGEEDHIERLLPVFFLNQIIDVRDPDFCRETRVNGATTCSGAVKLRTRIVGVNNIFRLHSQALEVSVKKRRVRINIQYPWNADAQLAAILHERNALFGHLRPGATRNLVSDFLDVGGAEDFLRGHVHEVRVLISNVIEPRLDLLHFLKIFNRSLFTGRNNQPLLTMHERDFGHFLDGDKVLDRLGSNVDKGAEAIVLAEIAASGLVSRGAVLDFAHCIKPYKRGHLTIPPQSQRFLRGSDRS